MSPRRSNRALAFKRTVRLQPYGVLGSGLDAHGRFLAHAGPDPTAAAATAAAAAAAAEVRDAADDGSGSGGGGVGGDLEGGGVCICDPAGLHHIQPPGGPKVTK